MCNRRVFRLVYLLALPLDRSPWLCPYRCHYLCCFCFCPWLGPVRFGRFGPKWRTIHPSKRLSLAALSPQRLSFRWIRQLCSFVSLPPSHSLSLSISLAPACFFCLLLHLLLVVVCFFFKQMVKKIKSVCDTVVARWPSTQSFIL